MNPTMYLHAVGTPNPAELLFNLRRSATPLPWERRPEDDRLAEPATPVDFDEDLPLESAAAVDTRWRAADARDLIALTLTGVAVMGLVAGVAFLAG